MVARVPFPRFSTKGNTKARSAKPAPAQAGRHRDSVNPEHVADDEELESYLAALAPETAPETTDTGRRFGDAQVLQLRFNLIALDELKQHALARGISPQALAQEWILERLSWEAQAASQRRQQARRY
jgi:hypothetical protein|nr:hypothetical protein [Thermocrispum municipale]